MVSVQEEGVCSLLAFGLEFCILPIADVGLIGGDGGPSSYSSTHASK